MSALFFKPMMVLRSSPTGCSHSILEFYKQRKPLNQRIPERLITTQQLVHVRSSDLITFRFNKDLEDLVRQFTDVYVKSKKGLA